MLAAVMVFAMTIPAAAAPGDTYTLTINSATSGHTYQAYQVFKGDYSEVTVDGATQKTLANIDWGTGVNGTALLAALKADGTIGENSHPVPVQMMLQLYCRERTSLPILRIWMHLRQL